MGRTLLIGTGGTTWRAWLKDNRGGRDLIVVDPADPEPSHLARAAFLRGGKVMRSCFYGSIDPMRAPHVLIAALAELLPLAKEDAIIQLFPLKGGPLAKHVVHLMAQLAAPSQILVPVDAPFDLNGFPVGPEEVELEAAFPDLVKSAQRKANWMKMLEKCEEHEVDLGRVSVQGARLGSGKRIKHEQLLKLGLEDVLYAESAGGTLFLVSETEPADHYLSRALDVFHCGRAHVTPPESYEGLLCSFARESGEDFGFGMVRSIDFRTMFAKVLCDAVAPAPVRILKLGGLRIDEAGRELGEARPWQI